MYKYKCRYFDIRELVSPDVHQKWGDRAWRFFNPTALMALDKLREYNPAKYGRFTVNNWQSGGNRKFSGFHLKGEFNRSEYSGHRAWGSFDIIPEKGSAKELRIDLLGHEPTVNGILPIIKGFEEITELEYGISWFHVRFFSNINGVLVYKPNE